MRYGLLDYLVWVIFLGSAVAALLNSERWEVFAPLAAKTEDVTLVTFSKDTRYVAMVVDGKKLRLLDFPSMKVVWEFEVPAEVRISAMTFAQDGSEVLVHGSKGVSLRMEPVTVHAQVKNGTFSIGPREIRFGPYPYLGHSSYLSANGDYLLRKYSNMDEFGAVVFHAKFPDGWIGQLYRLEVNVTLVALLFILYRIVRLRLSKRVSS